MDLILESSDLSLAVDDEQGTIKRIFHKDSNISLLKDRYAAIWLLIDGANFMTQAGKYKYGDVILTDIKVDPEQSSILMEKRSRAGGFIINEEIGLDGNDIYWNIALQGSEEDEKDLEVSFFVPVVEDNWVMWTPENAYVNISEDSQFCVEDNVPFICAWNPVSDLSLSLALDPSDIPPCAEKGSAIISSRLSSYYYRAKRIKLCPGRKTKLKLFLHTGKGFWKPSLKWFYQKFPRWFNPGLDTAGIDGAGLNISVDDYSDRELSLAECCNTKYAIMYGSSVSAVKEYRGFNNQTWIESDEELEKYTQMTRKTIRDLHKHAINAFIYYNATPCQKAYADKFRDSIVLTPKGKVRKGWWIPSDEHNQTYVMNMDSRYSWYRTSKARLLDLLERFPEADGVHHDGLHYDTVLDFGHSDGKSFYMGFDVARLGYSLCAWLEEVTEILHKRKKFLATNGATSFNTVKYGDLLILDDGRPEYYTKLMRVMAGNKQCIWKHKRMGSEKQKDFEFQRVLAYCALWRILPAAGRIIPLEEEAKIGGAWTRLFKLLARSTWLLEEDIEIKVNSLRLEYNLYRTEGQGYIIPVINKGDEPENLKIEVKGKALWDPVSLINIPIREIDSKKEYAGIINPREFRIFYIEGEKGNELFKLEDTKSAVAVKPIGDNAVCAV